MKTRKEKIDFIYEELARKELKFWCKLQVKNEISWWHITFEKWFEFILIKSRKDENVLYANEKVSWTFTFADFEFEDLKVIWLPLMIWDIMEYFYWESCKNFASLWIKKREPIDRQSDDCVDFIYEMIKDTK